MSNLSNLYTGLDYLRSIISSRLQLNKAQTGEVEFSNTAYYEDESPFAQFIMQHQPSFREYILLLMAIVPHIHPYFYSQLIAEHLLDGGEFPEFGGVKGANQRGILPTGETAQFILAGDDLKIRLEVQRLLSSEHWFVQKHILWLDTVPAGEPVMSGRLVLDPEVVEQLTTGIISKPRFSIDFPAEYVETDMNWDDLILHPNTLRHIKEIENWVKHSDTLLHQWGMKKKIKASNQRANIDDAFVHRFQSIIHFPMPCPEERYEMWHNTFPSQIEIAEDIDWRQVAARYELTGAGIINVAHFCAVEALADQTCRLDLKGLEKGIMREYIKEGKVV